MLLSVATLAASCGGEAPAPPGQRTMASAYDGVVVTRLSPDGVGFSRLDAFALDLESVQAAGGRLVATVRRPDRDAQWPVRGRFDAEQGSFRFDAFEGALTSTRAERVEALGGRADDDTGDGVADSLVGYINTSSTAAFGSDGAYVAVARAEARPALDGSKLSAAKSGVGRLELGGAAGCAEPSSAVELLHYTLDRDQPDFRSLRSRPDGSLPETTLSGLVGDVIVLRVLRAGRRSPPAWVFVRE